jgi:DNA polymerase-3 subunit epsilon
MARMPRAADPKVDTYLGVLEEALLDGFLSEAEKTAFVSVAAESGLSRGQVLDIHVGYLRALAEVALADNVVTSQERADLEVVARPLGQSSSDVETALRDGR